MSQYTMQYGGAGTGRAGSLLTPLLPRIAVGATQSVQLNLSTGLTHFEGSGMPNDRFHSKSKTKEKVAAPVTTTHWRC